MVSEWNRLLSTKYGIGNRSGLAHVESHGPKYFLENKNWTQFVKKQSIRWGHFFNWTTNLPIGHDALVVCYENVKTDTVRELKRMLEFLHYNCAGM